MIYLIQYGLLQISNYISRWLLFGNWQSGSRRKTCNLNRLSKLLQILLITKKLLSTHETKTNAQYTFFLMHQITPLI